MSGSDPSGTYRIPVELSVAEFKAASNVLAWRQTDWQDAALIYLGSFGTLILGIVAWMEGAFTPEVRLWGSVAFVACCGIVTPVRCRRLFRRLTTEHNGWNLIAIVSPTEVVEEDDFSVRRMSWADNTEIRQMKTMLAIIGHQTIILIPIRNITDLPGTLATLHRWHQAAR